MFFFSCAEQKKKNNRITVRLNSLLIDHYISKGDGCVYSTVKINLVLNSSYDNTIQLSTGTKPYMNVLKYLDTIITIHNPRQIEDSLCLGIIKKVDLNLLADVNVECVILNKSFTGKSLNEIRAEMSRWFDKDVFFKFEKLSDYKFKTIKSKNYKEKFKLDDMNVILSDSVNMNKRSQIPSIEELERLRKI